jgi:hypothetical protein
LLLIELLPTRESQAADESRKRAMECAGDAVPKDQRKRANEAMTAKKRNL